MMRLRLVFVMAAALAAPVAAKAEPAMTPGDRSHYNACLALVKSDPERAIANAQSWRIEGGGNLARQCLALAQFAHSDFPAALQSFEAVAMASESAKDGRAVALWSQAAEAAMTADLPADALRFLDRALATGDELSPRAEASLRVTRAEALVALTREKDAAADLDKATTLDPQVADGWLLKATLARRMGDLALAEAAIARAGEQTPGDAAVEYEAGNIAAAQGKDALARTAWTAAAAADPDSVPGKAATQALAAK